MGGGAGEVFTRGMFSLFQNFFFGPIALRCVCVCVCVESLLSFRMLLCVGCFGGNVLYMCIEYHSIYVNMYHVSTQGIDERMINVHYYYY